MNPEQKELIIKLKETAKQLNHSPKKREVYNLASRCYTHFGSFNKAKERAGLEIRNVIVTRFPEKAFSFGKDLAGIGSYLTFDGHIYNTLKGLMYSSKNIGDLKDFEKLIFNRFKIKGKYHLNSGGSRNQTHKFYVFNKVICKKLVDIGFPKGDKTNQKFSVPKWIRNNKEFSREYLRIAFLCEGSMKEKRKNPRIKINLAKTEEFLEAGISFMNELKEMLNVFGIRTTECGLCGKRIRKKDNQVSQDIRFRVITSDNNRFIKEIGWFK